MLCLAISLLFHQSKMLSFTSLSTGALSFIAIQEEASIKLAPVLSSLLRFTWNWKRLHLLWGNIMRALRGLAIPFLFIWSLNHLGSFASHHPAIHAKKATVASNFPMQSHRRKPAVISVLATWIQPWGLGWKCRTVCLILNPVNSPSSQPHLQAESCPCYFSLSLRTQLHSCNCFCLNSRAGKSYGRVKLIIY